METIWEAIFIKVQNIQYLNFHVCTVYSAIVGSFPYLRLTWHFHCYQTVWMVSSICHECHYLSVHGPHPSLGGILYELHPGPGVGLQAGPGDAGGGVGLGGADKLQGQLRVVRQIQLVHRHAGSVWNIHKSAKHSVMFFINSRWHSRFVSFWKAS